MASVKPNRLLVEGDEEVRLFPQLLDKHVDWGNRREEWVVEIIKCDGVEPILDSGLVGMHSKTSGLRALGIIVDADANVENRWTRIKNRWPKEFGELPDDLPPDGLIHKGLKGPRLGVWIMPDNRSSGMLETFLGALLRPDLATLWGFACDTCGESRDRGATYRDVHRDKAKIHTYLSWLDPPGMSLHVAVMRNAVETRTPLGQRFVRWFIDLFDLTPRPPESS